MSKFEHKIRHLMIIQSQVSILFIELVRGGEKHLRQLMALHFVYEDIATYLLRYEEGKPEPFDVFRSTRERVEEIAGEAFTKKMYERVEKALSSPK